MPPAPKKNTIRLIGDGGPGSCVIIDGASPRPDARKTAHDFLIASKDWSTDRADDATDNALVSKAWWGGDELGFVGYDHPEAKMVSTVSLNPTERG